MACLWDESSYQAYPQTNFDPTDIMEAVGNGFFFVMALVGFVIAVVTLPLWGPFYLIGKLFG